VQVSGSRLVALLALQPPLFLPDEAEQRGLHLLHVRDLGQHDLAVLARRLDHQPPAAEQPVQRTLLERHVGDPDQRDVAAAPGHDPIPQPQPPAPQPQLSRPSAVLDAAHLGDIEGALGRIRLSEEDQERRGFKRKLITFLAIVGPGLIVMVGDNDAGGVATYAQAGQNYDYSLLWVLLLLIPVLIINQEMVVRLGAVTGVGHARLINERFGRFWGWFSVGDLFLLNFLTIVTEFIGVSLALAYFGVSKYIAVPLTAVVLVVITASGSFRRWAPARRIRRGR